MSGIYTGPDGDDLHGDGREVHEPGAEQANVCPTCGSADPKKRLDIRDVSFGIVGVWKPCTNNSWHTPIPVAAPRDPQKLVDALGEAYVLLEGLRISVEWELAPSIKTAVAKWCPQAEAALKEWEENQ